MFAKFSKWNAAASSWGDWAHATLSKTVGDHTVPAGARRTVGCSPSASCGGSDTGKGVFIYRDGAGTGTNTFSGVKLKWLYGSDLVGDSDAVKVRVFGVEMVYIPAGAFWVGDGSSAPNGNFTDGSWSAGATIPVQIASEGELTIGQSAGNLWGTSTSGNNTIGPAGTLAAAFPKGYQAFYMMKYEASQGQYRDFLNTLTRAQQDTRTATNLAVGVTSVTNRYVMTNTSTVSYRSGIRAPAAMASSAPVVFSCDLTGDGVAETSGEWIAANYLSWMDTAAFADWAALRPLTELEFEKASRGPQAVLADEYAWGSASITQATGIANSGRSNEAPSNGAANCVYGSHASVQGPLRVGGVAANGAGTRAGAGGSYYGIMELSGNLWERPVSVGNATGRAFTGIHGNGILTSAGNADETNWPGLSGGQVTGATGSGFRGGTWHNAFSFERVSDRFSAADGNTGRGYASGARAARTSP